MKGVVVIPWSDEERDQLRRLVENGISHRQISVMLGRSKDSVHRQLQRLGLMRSDRNPVTRREQRQAGHPRGVRITLPPLPSLMEC